MRPYCENNCSNSFWVMVLGRPLTYKFASRMDAELGRAYDTYGEKRKGVLVSQSHPRHFGQIMFCSFTRHNPAEFRQDLFCKTSRVRKGWENKGRATETLKQTQRFLKCSHKTTIVQRQINVQLPTYGFVNLPPWVWVCG